MKNSEEFKTSVFSVHVLLAYEFEARSSVSIADGYGEPQGRHPETSDASEWEIKRYYYSSWWRRGINTESRSPSFRHRTSRSRSVKPSFKKIVQTPPTSTWINSKHLFTVGKGNSVCVRLHSQNHTNEPCYTRAWHAPEGRGIRILESFWLDEHKTSTGWVIKKYILFFPGAIISKTFLHFSPSGYTVSIKLIERNKKNLIFGSVDFTSRISPHEVFFFRLYGVFLEFRSGNPALNCGISLSLSLKKKKI